MEDDNGNARTVHRLACVATAVLPGWANSTWHQDEPSRRAAIAAVRDVARWIVERRPPGSGRALQELLPDAKAVARLKEGALAFKAEAVREA
jgi:hypothetical protein